MAKEKELEQLGCQVVVVACGSQEGGMEWLQKHGYHFLHLLDPDRVFYQQVGLRRFLKDSLCIETFKRYADEILAGTWKGEEPYSGSEEPYSGDDWAVMGGDFIVDSSGKLLYAYLCKNQYDRPDIETLLKVLQGQCS